LRLEREAERSRGQVALLNRTNQSKQSSIQELQRLMLELEQSLKTEEDLNAENLVKITELESQQKVYEEELKLALEKINPQKSVDSDLSSEIDTVTARVKQLCDEINLEVDSLKSEYTQPAPVYSETEYNIRSQEY
jgi:chromosome segregation ATPase